MPRFLKVCNRAGCPNTTRNRFGYCDVCAAARKERTAQTDTASQNWYSLKIWADTKAAFRMTFPEKALICDGVNPIDGEPCRKIATEIDHVIPFRGSWFLFLGGINFENLNGLCRECHGRKTAGEDNGWNNKQKVVATGEDDE